MTDEKTIDTWIIKDVDNTIYKLNADNWTVSYDGLKFFKNEVKIAHFIRWANYYKQSDVTTITEV